MDMNTSESASKLEVLRQAHDTLIADYVRAWTNVAWNLGRVPLHLPIAKRVEIRRQTKGRRQTAEAKAGGDQHSSIQLDMLEAQASLLDNLFAGATKAEKEEGT
jgi:hypothetical protein